MKFHTKSTLICVAVAGVFAGSVAGAEKSRGFTVDYSQCTEFVGVGPVDFARASSLVLAQRA